MTTEQELKEFRQEVAAWLKDNKPAEPDFPLPDSFMEVGTDEQFEYLKAWQQKVYDAGYLGMSWPEEYGGRGLPQVYQNIADAEMAKLRVPFMVNTIGLNWAGPVILHMGTEEQKKQYIKKILNAEEIWCQGFSEPDHGSDLGNAQLKAVKEGDEYVLNGSKIWTSLGTYSKHMILLARTSTEGQSKYAGLSFFLSPMDVKGIDVVPIQKITGEYGFAQTFFDDARIPASTMIGAEGEGWKVAMMTLAFERGAAAGQAGGQTMIQLEAKEVVELAKQVKRDCRPAIEDPIIRDQLVQFLIEERNHRLNTARKKIKPLTSDRPGAIPMGGKLTFTEFRRRLCMFAMSLQGNNAALYMGDSNAIANGQWQRSYFNAFSATIGGGTSEIQRNIIGERILGLPKS